MNLNERLGYGLENRILNVIKSYSARYEHKPCLNVALKLCESMTISHSEARLALHRLEQLGYIKVFGGLFYVTG